MASAAMPAIANFLMRTSLEKVDRRWALARPQSTYSLDRSAGLTRCNLPRCGFDQGEKSKPPAPDRVCLRRVVGRNLRLFNNHWRTAGYSPASKPAATEPTATEAMAVKSATAGPELGSKRGSMQLCRGEAEVATSRRPAEVGPRHAHRPLMIANLRERFRRPAVDAAYLSIKLRILQRVGFVQTTDRQIDDLAGRGVMASGSETAELERSWHYDMRGLRERNHLRLLRQLQGALRIGTACELVVKRLVRDGRIREHRIVPCLRLHEAVQQRADAVAERVVRVKLDVFLIVLDGILSQYVVIGRARGTRRKIVRRVDGFLLCRRLGCCKRGIAKEIEIARERRAFPGGLMPAGLIVHVETNALEQLLDRQVFLMRQPQERRGVRTVVADAVERFATRCSRIGHDRAVRRIDDRQSASGLVERGKRIVAAGIEDSDPQAARNRVQRRHHVDQPDRTTDQIGFGRNSCVDGNEIILARELHAVAGIINHGHRVRSAIRNLAGEILHDLNHLVVTGIRR